MPEPTAPQSAAAAAPVLAFRAARFAPGPGPAPPGDPVDLALGPGELLVVRAAAAGEGRWLADAAQGLLAPAAGAVLFRGDDWRRLGARAAERRRGEIGRVFSGPAWISNLDVEENVALRLRHHGRRSRREVAAQVGAAAAAFGVETLCRLRPAAVPAAELQRAQWIRAFAGTPALVLLEHPVPGDDPPDDRLVAAVRALRARGGAAVWITARDTEAGHPALAPCRRARLHGATGITPDEGA